MSTAAHCMPLDASGTIILGAHSLSSGGTQRIPVQRFILHPGWKLGGKYQHSAPFDYDIAILILSRPAIFNDHVSPICLPSPRTCFEAQTPCVVTGWGLDSEVGGFPEELQEVAVRVMDRENCRQYAGYGMNVTENMNCAGYEAGGKDACAGDSGGPLVCQVPGSSAWVLYGLVSWGYGCARPGAPGVYSSIPRLVNWISRATNGEVDYDNSHVWLVSYKIFKKWVKSKKMFYWPCYILGHSVFPIKATITILAEFSHQKLNLKPQQNQPNRSKLKYQNQNRQLPNH